MNDVLIVAIIFFGGFSIFKMISEHFLKRKIIKSGHFEKAGILTKSVNESAEANKYSSLKWGLVAILAGLGFILIEILRYNYPQLVNCIDGGAMAIGIELVFISLGFLIYFFIVTVKKK